MPPESSPRDAAPGTRKLRDFGRGVPSAKQGRQGPETWDSHLMRGIAAIRLGMLPARSPAGPTVATTASAVGRCRRPAAGPIQPLSSAVPGGAEGKRCGGGTAGAASTSRIGADSAPRWAPAWASAGGGLVVMLVVLWRVGADRADRRGRRLRRALQPGEHLGIRLPVPPPEWAFLGEDVSQEPREHQEGLGHLSAQLSTEPG